MNPLFRRFSPHKAQLCLSYAISLTPQYGDAFFEVFRNELDERTEYSPANDHVAAAIGVFCLYQRSASNVASPVAVVRPVDQQMHVF